MGIFIALLSGCLLYVFAGHVLPHSLVNEAGRPSGLVCLVVVALALMIYTGILWWQFRRAPARLDREGVPAPPAMDTGEPPAPEPVIDLPELKRALTWQSRWGWKRRVPWLLVTGESADIEQVAPGLTNQGWQLAGSAVLLWGGDAARGGHSPDLRALRELRGRQPVDAVIVVGQKTSWLQPDVTDTLHRGLQIMQQTLNWEVPCYLLDVNRDLTAEEVRPGHLAMALTGKPYTPDTLSAALQNLPATLAQRGLPQALDNPRHRFLLRLSAQLRRGGAASLSGALAPLINRWFAVPLHGLVFTGPQAGGMTYASRQITATPLWEQLSAHARLQPGKAPGLTAQHLLHGSLLALLLFWAGGSVYAWFANARLVADGQQNFSQASSAPPAELLLPVQQLLITLDNQQQHGTPWYHRFGMDMTDSLLPPVRSAFTHVSQAQIVAPAQQALRKQLQGSLLRNEGADTAQDYDRLKAYLMLAMPEQVEGKAAQAFLARQLTPLLPGVSPDFLAFFTRELAFHPEWKITPDNALVTQVRTTLLQHMSGQAVEEQLYQSLLASADRNYASLSLNQLLDGRDATEVFRLDADVPGHFTREAYDGEIAARIAALVKARQEQTGWVLAEGGHVSDNQLAPQALGERLTARYLSEFDTAWQKTMNQLTAIATQQPLEQLKQIADSNLSPQVALMKQLAWQGLTASPNERRYEVNPALTPFFSGIVAMVHGGGRHSLTLVTWQSQARRLRDRLNNLSSASGGVAALSRSVFQGTQIDNSFAEFPARLTAQLGKAQAPMIQALFLAPLSQTWQGAMKPGTGAMNRAWQEDIVKPWRQAFDNTFPFTDSRQDASLPVLIDFIRPDSGKIATFIATHLRGVVLYRDGRWQAADKLPPGLGVSPQFLKQLNQLDRLGHTLTDSGWGVRFKLQPGTAKDVVQTELVTDGLKLVYFNQMPFWKEMQWPGDTDYPGATLLWTSVRAGARLYFDTPGAWAFYRLLAKAKITPVDRTHYRITWTADDGLPLNYRLAFTPGNDPVSVLSLQGFVLPSTLFR